MANEFNQENIDKYLNQELSGEELAAFEAKLNSDAEFKKEVGLQGLLHRGINKHGEDEMRINLKKIRSEVLSEEGKETGAKVVEMGKTSKVRSLYKWAAAASVALAIGFALFLLNKNDSLTSDEAFAAYYEPYAGDINTRNATTEGLLNRASSLYQDKKYGAALPLFQQALNADANNAELQISTVSCLLELDQVENALMILGAVDNPLFVDQARWFSAMAHLKKGDRAAAVKALKGIKSGDYKYEAAVEILGKLGGE